jgi:hypothetical protein
MFAKLAVWLQPVSDALGVVFVPAMWILAVAYGLLGLAGVLAPGIAKGQIAMVHGSGRMRLFGIYLLLIGILVFSQASLFGNPIIPQAISVVVFLLGGVLLHIPAVGRIVGENMLDKGPSFFRVVALIYILIAGLFYSATRVHEVDELGVDPGRASNEARRGDRDDEDSAVPSDEAPADVPAVPEATTTQPADE